MSRSICFLFCVLFLAVECKGVRRVRPLLSEL
jgi:hypothetical protein